MEEKAVLRVRDRISAALTVPYVRRAVWLMAGGLAGFLTARGLVFGKYAPFAAAGAAAAPFSTMWAVILGGFARRGGHPLVAVGVKVHP